MPRQIRSGDTLKETTIVALKRAMDPLLGLMFDAGVTVHEFNQLVRDRAVRITAKRITKEIGRSSNSRVAIVTGLPRSEVARILRSRDAESSKHLGQHPARKVLAAWYNNPRYLTANGEPAILPIFGKIRSFEHLVISHSGGIPVRAMLDELTQIGAIDRLSGQRVKAKSRTPVLTGLNSRAVGAIGERARDLLETLSSNSRRLSKPLFEGTAVIGDASVEMIPFIRREIAEQGLSFINTANSILNRSRGQPRQSQTTNSKGCRVGVTVYYFQDGVPISSEYEVNPKRRKNLRRHLRPTKRKQTPTETTN